MYKNTSFSLDFGCPNGYMLRNQAKVSCFYAWNACRQTGSNEAKKNTDGHKILQAQKISHPRTLTLKNVKLSKNRCENKVFT